MTSRRRFDEVKNNPIKEIAKLGTLKIDQPVSKQDFIALCEKFPELQIEREKNGKLTIMSPVKFGSGNRESLVLGYLFIWWISNRNGKTLSSSTGVDLPDGSTRSPDCGWISDERLSQLSAEKQEDFYLKAVPEFIVEVRSKTDKISNLKKKMSDSWMKNGVLLGWLIDPYQEKVYIYRANQKVEILEGFSGKILSGEEVLPKMECPLDDLKLLK